MNNGKLLLVKLVPVLLLASCATQGRHTNVYNEFKVCSMSVEGDEWHLTIRRRKIGYVAYCSYYGLWNDPDRIRKYRQEKRLWHQRNTLLCDTVAYTWNGKEICLHRSYELDLYHPYTDSLQVAGGPFYHEGGGVYRARNVEGLHIYDLECGCMESYHQVKQQMPSPDARTVTRFLSSIKEDCLRNDSCAYDEISKLIKTLQTSYTVVWENSIQSLNETQRQMVQSLSDETEGESSF